MVCQNCGENEANVRYREIINGEKREFILCEKCSKELGIDSLDFSMPINFSSFFGGILGEYDSLDFPKLITSTQELKCNFCNMTYDEFMKYGKFGCANCYSAFQDRIEPILKTVHGDNQYLGRKSKVSEKKTEKEDVRKSSVNNKKDQEEKSSNDVVAIEKLQEQLRNAISEERYEDAAHIRDEIAKRRE